jgi:hypothetical protein
VGATVFSNDSFQEFHGEYEWLFDEGRLVGGKPVPGVGWVFIERTPVRGPRSRMAVRASTRKRARAASGSAAKKAQHTGPTSSGIELGPVPMPTSPPPRKKKKAAPPTKQAPKDAVREPPKEAPKEPKQASPKAEAKQAPAEAANQPLPFIEFVADHQVGTTVDGEVTQFSSHGAYITVGNVRCYAPLKLLGTPAPRSAREVLKRGETRTFVVHAIHAARRGIDLALPEAVSIEAPAARAPVPRNRPSTRRGATTGKTVPEVQPSLPTGTDQAPEDPEAELRESEATLAPAKKATARKSAAKKAAPRKKAAARKTAAKKTTARKTTARKSTARKSTAKKSTAKKSAAKKSTARKSAAKKTTAKRGAAKKATKKKATARKTTARKSTAKKSTAKKATRKRTAKKATAKKAPARKRTAKKTTARKTTARKRPAKRASAAKKR